MEAYGTREMMKILVKMIIGGSLGTLCFTFDDVIWIEHSLITLLLIESELLFAGLRVSGLLRKCDDSFSELFVRFEILFMAGLFYLADSSVCTLAEKDMQHFTLEMTCI